MLSTKRVAALSAVLLALNVWIAWRLFTAEYLDQMSSLAGIYIGMARYAAAHWRHLGWWPLWFCGMPLANVYEPSLPLSAALLTRLRGLGGAGADQPAVGGVYLLG